MKNAPPSFRYRKRYIVFKFISPEWVDKKDVARALWRNFLTLYGDTGAAESQMWLEYFDGTYGIVKCAHTFTEKVKITLSTLHKISGMDVLPVILGVTGTLKKAKKYMETNGG
jgi:RNase P/RNase MRP subunit POP5